MTSSFYSNNVKVQSSDHTYMFSTTDKIDALRWIEAIESSVKLEPSPSLLQASGGAVVYTGFITCQRLPLDSHTNPLFHTKDVNEGVDPLPVTLWSVLKSSGLIQCMIDGKPLDLVNVTEVAKVTVQNPPNTGEKAEYCIRFTTPNLLLVIQADTPTDHYEWVLAIEIILRKKNLGFILVNNKSRHSGYVALKRLMSLHIDGVRGSELVSPSVELEVLQDLYSDADHLSERASPDGCEERNTCTSTEGPPIPPRGSSAPPLPPRDPPPLPPKRGNSLQRVRTVSMASTLSISSAGSMEFDEYVVMQPPPPPSSLKFTSPTHSLSFYNTSQVCSIPSPITEGEDYMPMKPVSHFNDSISSQRSISSQPISIPGSLGRRGSTTKRCVLLRSASEIDGCYSNNNNEVTPPLPPRGSSPRHMRTNSSGSTNSLSRHSSSSLSSASFGGRVLHERINGSSYTSVLTDRGCVSNGRVSPLIPRSNSTAISHMPHPQAKLGEVSASDGLVIREVKEHIALNSTLGRTYNQMGSVSSVLSSDNGLDISGFSSSDSSTEDISQVSEKYQINTHFSVSLPLSLSVFLSLPLYFSSSFSFCFFSTLSLSLSQHLPDGWERGYSQKAKKHFYFNADLGLSKWNYEEVLLMAENGIDVRYINYSNHSN